MFFFFLLRYIYLPRHLFSEYLARHPRWDLFLLNLAINFFGKLQRSLKLLSIFLEAFRDSLVTVVESASESSTGTRANLHKVEAAEKGLLPGESTEYTTF
jgi:hypothetical protein